MAGVFGLGISRPLFDHDADLSGLSQEAWVDPGANHNTMRLQEAPMMDSLLQPQDHNWMVPPGSIPSPVPPAAPPPPPPPAIPVVIDFSLYEPPHGGTPGNYWADQAFQVAGQGGFEKVMATPAEGREAAYRDLGGPGE